MKKEFNSIKDAMKFVNDAQLDLTIRKNKIFNTKTNQLIGIINF
jgi:hypothetical protein